MNKQHHILSVEDNPNDVMLMKRVFAKNTPDHKVHFTPSSDEALDYLASKYQEENLPNLILLDIKLIRGNGLDLLNDLKRDSRYQHIPVVMLSSSDREDDKQKARAYGCDDYVEKPRTYLKLNEELPKIVNKWS
ncbi:response regulator [Aquimarina litoralis]|uniref:Response regulator n=1 Tax=Aquimarina litoralis TaxID=584605 RepID=A0ABP3TPE9_9FLAO